MPGEHPSLRRYRRFLVAFILVAAGAAALAGGVLLFKGKPFYGFLAVLVVGFLALLVHGYLEDDRERNKGAGGEGR